MLRNLELSRTHTRHLKEQSVQKCISSPKTLFLVYLVEKSGPGNEPKHWYPKLSRHVLKYWHYGDNYSDMLCFKNWKSKVNVYDGGKQIIWEVERNVSQEKQLSIDTRIEQEEWSIL